MSHLVRIQQAEASTPPPPPRPYAFGYAAGRFPGHIDRTHSEVSDGSGVVQGFVSIYSKLRHDVLLFNVFIIFRYTDKLNLKHNT